MCEQCRQCSTGKEGQPQGKGVPEKAPKEIQGSWKDKSSGKTVQKTAHASCPEEQMPWEQLLLTFTDGDRDRADASRHKKRSQGSGEGRHRLGRRQALDVTGT